MAAKAVSRDDLGMRRRLVWPALLLSLISAVPLIAQSSRTFVSVTGIDNAQCGRANPCRTFSAALVAVNAGGEVVALDSGGYGAVSISKSVAIIGAPGSHVAITATSGDAISVAILPTETVVLRGLYLTGLGALTGIDFQTGGSLYIENCVVNGFRAYGIDMTAGSASLNIVESVVRLSGFFADDGAGIRITPPEGAPSRVSIQRGRIEQNEFGLHIVNSEVIARDTVAAGNQSVAFM